MNNNNQNNKSSEKKNNYRMKKAKKKVCSFCADKVEKIDYKDINRLKKYITEKGKIFPRRISGACSKHQREVTNSIKLARNIALLPFTTD